MTQTDPSSASDDRFFKARIDAIYSIATAFILMDIVGSTMMAKLAVNVVGFYPLFWIIGSCLIIAGQCVAVALYHSGRMPRVATRTWAAILLLLYGLSGCSWGAAVGVSAALGTDNQVMFAVCVTLAGLTMSIANVSYWPIYVAFEVPVMAGAVVGFANSALSGHKALACAATIMMVALLFVSRRLSQQVLQAHRLAAANQALVDSLADRSQDLKVAIAALEQTSRTDPLTGIANRRARDERLEDEWRHAARTNRMLSIIAIDVDHFKRFNDTYGHDEGDRALQAVAATLVTVTREGFDTAARHGGEEFMLILPDISIEHAAIVAERLREVVARCHSEFDLPAQLTVSLGVATTRPASGGDVRQLSVAADTALYRAKMAGRNRVEIAGEPNATALSAIGRSGVIPS